MHARVNVDGLNLYRGAVGASRGSLAACLHLGLSDRILSDTLRAWSPSARPKSMNDGSTSFETNRRRRGLLRASAGCHWMKTKPIKTRPWDAADHLQDELDVAAYLDAAFEDGDPQLIAAALGDVARSRGMSRIAAKTGLGRESLYKALSADGNPGFATVLRVMQALDFRLILRPLNTTLQSSPVIE